MNYLNRETKLVMRKKLASCESVRFKGGQILIHADNSKTIIEIHTEHGWRMGKWSNPLKVKRGGGSGSIACDARTILLYSEQLSEEDKMNMEKRAWERNGGRLYQKI